MTEQVVKCGLCNITKGNVIFCSKEWRVILVEEKHYPGFCRVVWNEHVSEMTDLPAKSRDLLMHVVWVVEQTLRDIMGAHKINLASLGNMVPHIHWHVIPRYSDDAHFPNPIWSSVGDIEIDVSEKMNLLPRLTMELESRLRSFEKNNISSTS